MHHLTPTPITTAPANCLSRLPPRRWARPFTVAEVLVGPARAGRLEHARRALSALGVEEIPLPTDASTRLAALRAETNLRLPDCCVLMAAREAGAQTVLSFDEDLAATARGLGFTVP